MKAVIDSVECQRDSPRFRQLLDQNEKDLEALESKLEKVVKQCSQMVSTGRQYTHEQEQLVSVLWDVSGHFSRDTVVQAALNKLLTALGEAAKYQAILVDQAARAIARNMTSFIKNELRQIKESRQFFERVSGELDSVVQRAAGLPRLRPGEGDDLSKQVLATRRAFRHTALDYVHEISAAQAKKRCNVVDALLSYMKAYSTFFHQGTDLCEDLKPWLNTIAEEVSGMRSEVDELERSEESRHSDVRDDDLILTEDQRDSRLPVIMHGYLFKRANNAFKTWNRRYFTLQNNQLVYRKRSGEEVTVMEEDLRLCSVKPAAEIDRRHCFELLSPNKIHLLQAESEETCRAWIETLQRGIGAALQCGFSAGDDANRLHTPATPSNSLSISTTSLNTSSFYSLLPLTGSPEGGVGPRRSLANPGVPDPSDQGAWPSKQELWASVLSVGGNNACCDCDAPNPKWASANLGITLCIECSGIHRSLGVHHSRVKSLTLDDWEPPVLKLLLELGNTTVNGVYSHLPSQGYSPATPTCSREQREAWIRAKYVKKLFVKPLPATLPSDSSPSERALERTWSVPRRSRFRDYRDTGHRQSRRPATADPASTLRADVSSGDSSPASSPQSSRSVVPDLLASPSTPAPLMLDAPEGEQQVETVPLSLAALLGEHSDTDDDEEVDRVSEPVSALTAKALLARAARVHNLPMMCHALALSAALTDLHPQGSAAATPLHHAIKSGSLTAVEYLLLNGAAPNLPDAEGRTALHLAVSRCSIPQVYRLLQHRSTDLTLADSAGAKALDLALHTNQPDLVALLRFASLSEHFERDEVDSMMQAIMADLNNKMRLNSAAAAAAAAAIATEGVTGGGGGTSPSKDG